MRVFKTKRHANGSIVKYKARLVAKGCSQRKGIDFEETYSPVIRYSSLRFLLSLTVKYDLYVEQLDAVTAFLQGELSEEIYLRPPEGLEIPSNKVLRLQKSIYGLKQSSRSWNKKLSDVLKKFGLKQSDYDPCVYYNNSKKDKWLVVAIYVDDILIFSSCKDSMRKLKQFLKSHFEMKELGEAKSFLGLNLSYDRKAGKLSIDQNKYISSMLDRFGMQNCNPVMTPMDMSTKLSKEQCPKSNEELNEMRNIPYQELIGSLLYAAQISRPDICYAVNYLSRFNNNPGKIHWLAAKRILRYLKGSMDYKLTYVKIADSSIIGFCDSDYANDIDERKSVNGYVFLSQNGAISWSSKKQSTTALSTTEAEYVSISSAVQEALWIKGFQGEIEGKSPTTLLYSDNQSAIHLASNESYHPRTKHIDVRHHFVRQIIQAGQIELKHIPTQNMVADIMTKSLPSIKCNLFSKGMGLNKISSSGDVEMRT